jgi:FAD/FMN-containing dehydrogenase/Fe-S oxidoreductase
MKEELFYPDTLINALVAQLKKNVRGEVKFDEAYKALYATDSSNYRQVPIGVVFPLDKDDVINTVAACNKYKVPILCRGGGTSLAGQCCNVAVIMDFSKHYNKILSIDVKNKTISVEPGIVLDDLRKKVEPLGLTFGPDPATHNHCTIGGMIGNNSCGVHSVMASWEGDGARTCDFLEEMEVLLYDGTIITVGRTNEEELQSIISKDDRKGKIYRSLWELAEKNSSLINTKYPRIPRRVSGYNLDELMPEKKFNVARSLAGTESTCVVILSATLKLIHHFNYRSLVVLGYEDVYESAKHISEILKFKPTGLEGVDDKLMEFMKRKNLHVDLIKLLPEGKGWLWVEFGGDSQLQAEEYAQQLIRYLEALENKPSIKFFKTTEEQIRIWRVRDSGLGATAFVPDWPDTWEGWEDAAVPPEKLSEYLVHFRRLLNKYNYETTMYGHFGQGCIHCRINFDFVTEEGIRKYKAFTEEAADLVISFGGSLSGEHGDGQSRGELLEKMFGQQLVDAFHDFKKIWDPDWKMNPGKIIDAYSRDSNLRLGAHFKFKETETYFKFPDDKGSIGRASMRCVGVGECRKTDKGTMCPSYMITRDEKHSTRGRAHLLFEMLTRDVINNGWRSREIKEALDLCLACKGCLGECPVNVDMATYKAEFFAQYYKGRIRPVHAYVFGMIDRWAQLSSAFPSAINYLTHSKALKNISKHIFNIHSSREFPHFAQQSFTKWFRRREVDRSGKKEKVVLWPDTFNNYFFPDTLKAAVKVLESAGYKILLPAEKVCCGRPLYDFGMLKRAKRLLNHSLDQIKNFINDDVSIVGLEPSCVSVFRNELPGLFPHDNYVNKVTKNFFTLAEFINTKNVKFNFSKLNKTALYLAHCHHKAILNAENDLSVLNNLDLNYNSPDAGCCGMAGSFGFQKGINYNISMQIGERILFPSIRSLENNALVIADGFSCREQIIHGTGRKAVHLAEVLATAIE